MAGTISTCCEPHYFSIANKAMKKPRQRHLCLCTGVLSGLFYLQLLVFTLYTFGHEQKAIAPGALSIPSEIIVNQSHLMLPRQHQQQQHQMQHSNQNATTLTLPKHKRFAYAFYATTEGHACAAFVNIAALRETGTRDDDVDFIVLTYGFNNKMMRDQAQKMNVVVKEVAHLKNFQGGASYYRDVMVKLRVFQLFEYDRVIYMDADMLVRKNLDHLFFLPEASHIAGPRVYFQQFDGRPNYFCSCLMVFTPEQHMWERVMSWYLPSGFVKEKKLYDMDLLNREFIDEATILPGIYEMLSSHLLSEGKWKIALAKKPYMGKKLGMPNRTWEEIYNATSIIHFTGAKPTNQKTIGQLKTWTKTKKDNPADPRYFAVFERFYSLASMVCPFGFKYTASNEYSKWL